MKIETILKNEETNADAIVLYKEGIFYRAYERSAMRFTEYIAPYKVFKKHYKVVNANVCYLGFPQKALSNLLQARGLTSYTETEYYFVIHHCPSSMDFSQWKTSIQLPTFEDVKPQLLLRERVKPKDLNNLQVYKAGYDAMLELHRMVANLPREYKFSIGDRIKLEAMELGIASYRIGLEKMISENRSAILERIETIRLLLRMLKDLKQLSLKYFTSINVQLETLYLFLEK